MLPPNMPRNLRMMVTGWQQCWVFPPDQGMAWQLKSFWIHSIQLLFWCLPSSSFWLLWSLLLFETYGKIFSARSLLDFSSTPSSVTSSTDYAGPSRGRLALLYINTNKYRNVKEGGFNRCDVLKLSLRIGRGTEVGEGRCFSLYASSAGLESL